MCASPSLAFAPLSLAYGAVVRARLALYGAGVLKSQRVGAPVISVGNITAGGTGKTPLVEWLARAAALEGRRVCILTRGYGRAQADRRVVVSDGIRVLAEAREGGDEPRMLAEALTGSSVAVVSDADRIAAALWARQHLGSDAFILDDGFQHLRIARHLDIVTLDALAPWGGGHLLPRGRLREPLRQLARADLIVITRADLSADIETLRAEARRLGGGRAQVLTSRLRTDALRPLRPEPLHSGDETFERVSSEQFNQEQAFAAFCAIGNPEAFFTQLRRDGRKLTYTRAFPDHHPYTQSEVERVCDEALRHDARALLTTAKDAVKLRSFDFKLPCYVVEASLEFEDEESLRALLRAALSGEASRERFS